MSSEINATTRRLHIQENQGEGLKLRRYFSVLLKRAIIRFQNVGEKVTNPKIKEEYKLNVSTKMVQRHLTKVGAKYKRSKHQIILSRLHKD